MQMPLRFLLAACIGLISLLPVGAVTTPVKLAQTISFSKPTYFNRYGEPPLVLTATASSGLPVSFVVTSGPGTISGNLLTLNAPGRIYINAVQPGDAAYAPAKAVTRFVNVIYGSQRITPFEPIPDQVLGTKPFPILLPTSSAGLPVIVDVVSGPALLSGNTLTLTGIGTVRLRARQAGDAKYYAATSISTSFEVTAAPVITSLKLAEGVITKPFSYQIVGTGGPTSFTLTGTLPLGLRFNTRHGLLSGICKQTGTFNLVMSATSKQGTGSSNLRIVVVENVPHLYVANYASGTVGEYTTSGYPINTALIKDLNGPKGLAVADGFIYVVDYGGTIGKYTTTGDVVNARLVTGIYGPSALAVSGNTLYVATGIYDSVAAYTTSGEPVNVALISSGLRAPFGIAANGTNLFVSSMGPGYVAQYTLSGTRLFAALVKGLGGPTGLAVTDSNIYVLNNDIGTIGKYTLAGKPVATTLATGLSQPYDIEVSGDTIFVTNGSTNSISAFSTSGAVINPYLVVGLHSPCGVAVGAP